MRGHANRVGVPLLLAVAVNMVSAACPAVACDLCAIYTATEMRETRRGLQLGVSEQYTHFGTLKNDGHQVDNTAGERLDSSITQLVFGYNFNELFGAQLALPIVSRNFRRLEAGQLVHGDETGIGDLTLLGIVRPFRWVDERSVLGGSLLGGLKLPSGSADRLREELAEDGHEGAALGRAVHLGAHGDTPSGIHGHDLALGSGSVDGIIGGQIFASWRRVFLSTMVQYVIRTEGDIDYRYANDLLWSGGPGAFVLLGHEYTLTAQAVVSGEHKGKDTLDGEAQGDTAITAVYLGPSFGFTWGTSLAADFGADLPISQDNSDLQLVPDYRIHGGVTWRF